MAFARSKNGALQHALVETIARGLLLKIFRGLSNTNVNSVLTLVAIARVEVVERSYRNSCIVITHLIVNWFEAEEGARSSWDQQASYQ